MVTILPPLKIVYATAWFGTRKFSQDNQVGYDCPIPKGYTFNFTDKTSSWCTVTSSTEEIDSATGIILHAPDTQLSNLPKRVKNQPWILESLEAPFSSPFRSDSAIMPKYFDYLASYNFKASFSFSYFSPGIMDVANRLLPKDFIKTKTGAAPILWIAKNCRATNGREKYIEKLMEYIDVHSYGECLNNHDFPSDKSREDLLTEYKFYLAVENCNCEDYVTEKLYDALLHSAVPIVDGPPNYEGYIPSNRSIIYMDAYPDPKDLADYIQYLNQNDTAYLEYLAFRRDAINIAPKDRLQPAFIGNWSDTLAHKERSSYCSVCRGLVPWWESKLQDGDYTDGNKKDRFLVDETCQAAGKWDYIANGEAPYSPPWTPRPRDEFTRPSSLPPSTNNNIANQSLDDYKVITPRPMTQQDKFHQIEVPLLVNGGYTFLFFLFIAFLYRESRKFSHLRLQDPIV